MTEAARQVFSGAKVMLFSGDRLIVLRRDHTPGIPWPGYLDFPGGAREGTESPEACVLRETHEELGLRFKADDLIFAHLRDRGADTGWFFALHGPEDLPQKVVFGDEGAGWHVMPPKDFVAASDAVPHFREILAGYLARIRRGRV